MVDKLRLLLGGGDEALLEYYLETVSRVVLDYCNLDELPEGLENTVVAMAADLVRMNTDGGEVRSLTEGSKSVAFRAASESDVSGLLKDYTKQLNRYRRVLW